MTYYAEHELSRRKTDIARMHDVLPSAAAPLEIAIRSMLDYKNTTGA